MNDKAQIKKALVVLSPDLIRPGKPENSMLLQRAVSLAKATGCELELFHVCYDGVLEDGLFLSREELESAKKQFTDEQATRVAELAHNLGRRSVKVSHQTRWDHPRTDALLRKIGKCSPDLVLKQAREHSYILGLASNTDWELARRSPADVWLVSDEVADIERIVTAVGDRSFDDADITTSADNELLRKAGLIRDAFEADNHLVNAFQLPVSPGFVAGPTGAAAAIPVIEHQKLRKATVKRHRGVVRALARYFDIAPGNVHVREGQPDKVIPKVAEKVAADLIVLGARNLGRLERVIGQVTVEPVMSRTTCDIFVAREHEPAAIPEADTPPLYGDPKISLERAIVDPEGYFRSPQQVANLPELSIDLRSRILQAWEYDIRAEMAEENEGGPVADIDINDLDKVLAAQSLLQTKKAESRNKYPTLQESSG